MYDIDRRSKKLSITLGFWKFIDTHKLYYWENFLYLSYLLMYMSPVYCGPSQGFVLKKCMIIYATLWIWWRSRNKNWKDFLNFFGQYVQSCSTIFLPLYSSASNNCHFKCEDSPKHKHYKIMKGQIYSVISIKQ